MSLSFRRVAAVALMALAMAWPSAAQQPIRLDIRGGRVTLHAQNASLRAILTEWARVGGTRFVNLERVAGNPITVDLTDVSERQALDTLLRNVAGYLLGSRQGSTPGTSTFDRVFILASSNAPAAPRPTPIGNGPATRVPQPFDPGEENPAGDVVPGQPTRVNPRPAGVPRGPIIVPPGVTFPPGATPPGVQPDPPEPPDNDSPNNGGVVIITPANPFGVPAGSGTPGVVTPVQRPQQSQTPRIQDPD